MASKHTIASPQASAPPITMPLRATATEFQMMECGIHARPKHLPRDQLESYRTPLPLNSKKRYRRTLKKGEKRGSCVCDYHDFPKLLRERLSVGEEYKNVKKPFPFLKLPAEIRNQIYEELFDYDQPIEFCPEPFCFEGRYLKWRYEGDWQDDYDIIKASNRTWFRENIYAAAPFLRVNKQICNEATPILYQNEMRFTNMTGWVALDNFLFMIGLNKAGMLRKLNVCHPNCFEGPRSIGKENDWSTGSPQIVTPTSAREDGFGYGKRWFLEELSKDPVLVLQKAGKLQHLGLVSPVMSLDGFTTSPFDWTKFEDLTITVISLRSEKHGPHYFGTDESKDLDYAKQIAETHFADTGEKWEYLDAEIGEDGKY